MSESVADIMTVHSKYPRMHFLKKKKKNILAYNHSTIIMPKKLRSPY